MTHKQTTLRLPVELMEKLRKQAEEKGIPIKDLVVLILNDALSCPHRHQKR